MTAPAAVLEQIEAVLLANEKRAAVAHSKGEDKGEWWQAMNARVNFQVYVLERKYTTKEAA